MKKTICDLCGSELELMPALEVKVGAHTIPIDVCTPCCGDLTATLTDKERMSFDDGDKQKAEHVKRMRARIVSAFKSIRFPGGVNDSNRKEVPAQTGGGQGSDPAK